MPAMGIAWPSVRVSAYVSLDETTLGKIDRGTPNNLSNSSSQSPVRMLKSIVREALETSVMWVCPSVRFQTSQESTVPKARRPARALARAPFVLSSSH